MWISVSIFELSKYSWWQRRLLFKKLHLDFVIQACLAFPRQNRLNVSFENIIWQWEKKNSSRRMENHKLKIKRPFECLFYIVSVYWISVLKTVFKNRWCHHLFCHFSTLPLLYTKCSAILLNDLINCIKLRSKAPPVLHHKVALLRRRTG